MASTLQLPFDVQMRYDIAQIMRRHAMTSFPANIVISFALLAIHFRGSDDLRIFWYALALNVINLGHLYLILAVPRHEAGSLKRWFTVQYAVAMATACWVSATATFGLYFSVGALDPALAMALVIAYASALTMALLPLPRLNMITTILGTVPFTVITAMEAEKVGIGIPLILGIYTFCLYKYASVHSGLLLKSIRLRLQNDYLNDKLARERDLVIAASLAKSRFFAAASHDLRQPLHALSLLLSAFDRPGRPVEDRRFVSQMTKSLASLEMLFSALLDISRLDQGDIEANPVHFRLQDLFDALELRFSEAAACKKIWLRIVPSDAVIHCDPVLMERVLSNLISNAINATDSGGVWVAYRAWRGVVEVRDSGCGIPADALPRIYDEFYQVSNPGRNRRQGLGLGLATVRRLLLLLGTRPTVRSTLGKGTVFSIPVKRGLATLMQAKPSDRDAEHDHDIDLNGLRLMVIDDDVDVLDAIHLLGHQWNCEVRTASSADDAWQLVESGYRPQVLLADYWLQEGEDGLTLTRRLISHFEGNLVAHLVTADTRPEAMAVSRASGIGLIHKPISPNRLLELLTSVPQPSAVAYCAEK